jgi:hypothetical protein
VCRQSDRIRGASSLNLNSLRFVFLRRVIFKRGDRERKAEAAAAGIPAARPGSLVRRDGANDTGRRGPPAPPVSSARPPGDPVRSGRNGRRRDDAPDGREVIGLATDMYVPVRVTVVDGGCLS